MSDPPDMGMDPRCRSITLQPRVIVKTASKHKFVFGFDLPNSIPVLSFELAQNPFFESRSIGEWFKEIALQV